MHMKPCFEKSKPPHSFPVLVSSDSFSKNANISPLHSIVDLNVYPFAKSASISFNIFFRLAPSCTVGSALLTIIKGLSCQFVMLYLLYTVDTPLSAIGFNRLKLQVIQQRQRTNIDMTNNIDDIQLKSIST